MGVSTVLGSEASIKCSEDWTRVVKIKECDYRIDPSTITDFLENCCKVMSVMVENVFYIKEDSEGVKVIEIYSVKVRVNTPIVQLVPLDGRRVNLHFRNIQKQSTKCFSPHLGRNCTNVKVQCLAYVAKFIQSSSRLDELGSLTDWKNNKKLAKLTTTLKIGPSDEKNGENSKEVGSP
jgi:hypothetical protein